MESKKISDSLTYQVHIVNPKHLNGMGRIFGGTLMTWIDTVAGVVARRHSGFDVSTAAVDYLQFKMPAYRNDIICLKGYLTAVFNTSMEVCVETYKEDLNGNHQLINRAFLVFVALSDNKPIKVPPLIYETEEEKDEYTSAVQRNRIRKNRRMLNF